MEKKILVVDDDFNIRYLMSKILKDRGYSVYTAEDGISALRILGIERFNVLITDLKMPNMDGIELFNRVKELYPQMHVIFLTGSEYINLISRGLKNDTFYYFEKPVDVKRLKCTLEHLLDDNKEFNNEK
ncbi:MAG: response regulator [Deltaproteobacteria bacterium]|nr:response regulator [Deltaproteobacteria bacterium]MBW2184335.1 response regulator [Deltaproteobacteria bacterium]